MKYIASSAVVVTLALLTGSMAASATSGATADGNYGNTGEVEFKASVSPELPLHPEQPDPNKPVTPINPIDPEKPIKPGTNGPLSIDYVSDFQFGEQMISTKDQTYYALPQVFEGELPDTANYIQVTDKRGTSAGWDLSVSQADNFKSTVDTENNELEGLELTIDASTGELNSTSDSEKPTAKKVVLNGAGSSGEVLAADYLEGTGSWTSTIGELMENPNEEKVEETPIVNKGVELFIPGDVQTDAVTYSTTLNWTLEQKP